jgi:ABC-type multidrug transport system permease subunit
MAAIGIGLVLAMYVGTIIASGVHFLRLQRTLRSEWRDRLYRFLDQGEYDRMVTNPVASAERGFWIASCASGAMALGLLVSVCLIAGQG